MCAHVELWHSRKGRGFITTLGQLSRPKTQSCVRRQGRSIDSCDLAAPPHSTPVASRDCECQLFEKA